MFDFTYGGGVTSHQEQMPLLLLALYGGFAFLLWIFRAKSSFPVPVSPSIKSQHLANMTAPRRTRTW